ncbi:hypothetical protein H0H93_002663 [Arthromyces matolae]|nr:hypothetical protein H0H93_002663 [Arthromyces matolae]
MKTTLLLITSYILLVIASPVPREASILQPRSYVDDSGLSIGIRADTHNPHYSQLDAVPTDENAAFNYSFGNTVEGKSITLGLGKPEKLPQLGPLPNALDSQTIDTLERIATNISGLFHQIIRHIMDDKNQISRVANFVSDGNIKHLQTPPRRRPPLEMPPLPEPARGGVHDTKDLLTFIKASHKKLESVVRHRNYKLISLRDVQGFNGNIPDSDPPNVYVAFWKKSHVQPSAKPSIASEPGTYSFGKSKNGEDITRTIGLPQQMPQIAPLPKDWQHFDDIELIRIATEMAAEDESGESNSYNIIRRVMDDRNKISRAISSLKRNRTSWHATLLRPVSVPQLPDRGLSAEDHRKQLLNMIQRTHKKLANTVMDRNGQLRTLDALQVSHIIAHNLNPINEYVGYWIESHKQPSTRALVPGAVGDTSRAKKRPQNTHSPPQTTEVTRPSKRPTTQSPSRDSANPTSPLGKMFQEVNVAPSSGGPPIPHWTGLNVTASPSEISNHPIPVDPGVQPPCEDTSLKFEDWCVFPDS